MKTKLLSVLLAFITLHSFSQISFEKGYFIDNNNQRVECFIKNTDWKNNPKEFEYKFEADSMSQKGNLNTVKEFGVTGFSRYVRADTKIDISPTAYDHLSRDRNPEWSQEKLFLKVLVDGKAVLYYYEKNGLVRFFYSVSDTSINQLIYKEYFVANDQVAENFKFREQLWTDVRCPNTTASIVDQLNYRKSDLKNYFIKYNKDNNIIPGIYEKKEGKDAFHLKITPGFCYSSLIISNTVYDNYNTKFNNQLNFRMGLEGEYILPFNKNKWGVIFEPTFQYFNAKVEKSNANVTLHFNAIEFPIGCRYYFFLNKELKLFANAMYIPNLSFGFNSTFVYQSTISSVSQTTIELKGGQSLAFGGGIGYKKFSAELRYYTDRDIFSDYQSWYIDYQKYMLILGFRIL
jgi:hypothetical protein